MYTRFLLQLQLIILLIKYKSNLSLAVSKHRMGKNGTQLFTLYWLQKSIYLLYFVIEYYRYQEQNIKYKKTFYAVALRYFFLLYFIDWKSMLAILNKKSRYCNRKLIIGLISHYSFCLQFYILLL